MLVVKLRDEWLKASFSAVSITKSTPLDVILLPLHPGQENDTSYKGKGKRKNMKGQNQNIAPYAIFYTTISHYRIPTIH